jgi:protein-L-isoaspartate(D-aspartate) O-methyltransferase
MNFEAARLNMVESQVRPNGVTDARVLDAMARIKREDFVPEERRKLAYLDGEVHSAAAGRVLPPPMALARMFQAALVRKTDKVLIVAAGAGYGALIAADLAAHVTALEENVELAAELRANCSERPNIHVVDGPHRAGHTPGAPYDVILVEGRLRQVPDALLGQLAPNGRLVCGLGERDTCSIVVITSDDRHHASRAVFDASLSELPGFPVKQAEFVF